MILKYELQFVAFTWPNICDHWTCSCSYFIATVRLVGWLGLNGTFSTNRPYRAVGKVKVC